MENEANQRYLRQLSENYPTIAQASTEIINLQSILNLPKGTEHFMSDLHGEYEAFSHVLRNGSGAVRKKIDEVFGHTLGIADKMTLATLIYYPKEKIELEKQSQSDMNDWYKITLYRLIDLCKVVSSKYTRSKVRKAIPREYAYVIEELITEKPEVLNKEAYYEAIVNSIVDLGRAEEFIRVLAHLIQRLVIDHLHIIGDIFDRGPEPDRIMDGLCDYHSLDIQWGNHDVLWMGAAAGHEACITNVIRNCIAYGNLDILEESYGINMLPLATFALKTYEEDPCDLFETKKSVAFKEDAAMLAKMHKAIVILKLKLEGALVVKRPDFHMEDRNLLEYVDYEKGVLLLDGRSYQMKDSRFPTIDPKNPNRLTEEEAEVMHRLRHSFLNCEKLQKHVQLLLQVGNLYKIYNNNLLFHGCIPLNADGTFQQVTIYGKSCHGKELYEVLESYVRKAFFAECEEEREKGRDILWYLWTAPESPLYGRSKMANFERYFLEEKELRKEEKNPYYQWIEKPETALQIFKEFGMDEKTAHIINGHVPVHRLAGEKPVKADGKVLMIDGGFSKAYQATTGIAGYTLIFNSYGLILTAHDPFVSKDTAIHEEIDIVSRRESVEYMDRRILVGDTDNGKRIREKIADLKLLIAAYRSGEIQEKVKKNH